MNKQTMGRRKFLKITGNGLLALAAGTFIGCKESGVMDEVIDEVTHNDYPATEAEGDAAIESGISEYLNSKSLRFQVHDNKKIHTNKEGTFDKVFDVFADGGESYTMRLAGNYVTSGETAQYIDDFDRIRTFEIIKADRTTKEYIHKQFYNWVSGIV